MITKELERAREYEAIFAPTVAPEQRPAFHVTPTVGWMNDPNGFSVYRGEYHLFHQYHPYSDAWGPMHWGHLKSRDLIRWERLPAALAPDQEYDRDGCFSGSALELPDGKQLLVYTGVSKTENPNGDITEAQTQCIALGNGIDYEKSSLNPVLDGQALPEGSSTADFRDPKIWQETDGSYRMAAANRTADGCGAVLMFESRDALHWRYAGTLDASRNEFGRMWECPDFFSLDGTQVIMISPQNMPPMDLEFHPGSNTAWLIGEMKPGTARFTRRAVQPVDYGIDFYAPQTLLTPDGRRVMIGWMQNWETAGYKMENCPWFGQMTLPRELRLENGRILQVPVRELDAYHRERRIYQSVAIQDELILPGISGRMADITVTVRPGSDSFRSFQLQFARGGRYSTVICWNAKNGTVTVDRSRSGLDYDILHSRTFPVRAKDGCLKLRLVLDRFSAELFVNDGEQAASTAIYTPQEADGITFSAQGEACMDIEKYALTPDGE